MITRPATRGPDTWEELKRRFTTYRHVPSLTNMSPRPFTPTGRLTADWRRRYKATANSAIKRVSETIDQLRIARLLPPRPSKLRQSHITAIARAARRKELRPRSALRLFWEAFILDCAGYRCNYCKRSPRSVLKETKGRRGLRLVVDHCVPLDSSLRKKLRAELRDLTLKKCVCACWLCNTLKAHFPQRVFEEEINSLLRAVRAHQQAR